jgi:hypothetical protein
VSLPFYFILFYIKKKAYRSSNVGSRDFCGLRSRVPTEMSPNSGDVLDATDRVEPNKMPHFFFHRFSQFLVYNKLNNRQKMLKKLKKKNRVSGNIRIDIE